MAKENRTNGNDRSRNAKSGRAVSRKSADGSWSNRTQAPRIAGVKQRQDNVARATKRIKTDVQVDVVRSRRG